MTPTTDDSPTRDELLTLLRDRPDWHTIEDATDRYRRWSLLVERVIAEAR